MKKELPIQSQEYKDRYIEEFKRLLGVDHEIAVEDYHAFKDDTMGDPDVGDSDPEEDAAEQASYWNG